MITRIAFCLVAVALGVLVVLTRRPLARVVHYRLDLAKYSALREPSASNRAWLRYYEIAIAVCALALAAAAIAWAAAGA